jgi:hypothetical protein
VRGAHVILVRQDPSAQRLETRPQINQGCVKFEQADRGAAHGVDGGLGILEGLEYLFSEKS